MSSIFFVQQPCSNPDRVREFPLRRQRPRLVSQTSGGLYELFFEEVGKPADGRDPGPLGFEGRPEVSKIAEVAAKYGIEISPPIAP